MRRRERGASLRGAVPLAALAALALLFASVSCSRSPGVLAIVAPEGLAVAPADFPPLPQAWAFQPQAENGAAGADCSLVLEWRRLGDGREATGTVLRRRWLAPALAMTDLRFDLGRAEAEAQGLRELSTIEAPLRVPAVEGHLPGDAAWPFTEVLVGRLEPRSGKRARSLETWWKKAETALGKSLGGESPWRLGAVGDMQFGPDEAPLVTGGRQGLEKVFGRILPIMEAQDILVGNLEGSITLATEGNPRKRFQFRMPPGTSTGLKAAGFDLVLLGNNHALDFGPAGFADTLADTVAAGLPTVGAGQTAADALAARRLGITGHSGAGVSFIGFASFPAERYGFTTAEAEAGPAKPGINADEAATLDAIRAEAAKGHFVVVLAHGGSEYRFDPAPEIRVRYRSFIDAGAGLVLGSHPHLLQGVEAWDGGIIAYSLGNFLFTGEREPEEALHSALLSFLVYRGRVRGFAPTAVRAGYAGTGLDEAGGRATIEGFAARCASLTNPRP